MRHHPPIYENIEEASPRQFVQSSATLIGARIVAPSHAAGCYRAIEVGIY